MVVNLQILDNIAETKSSKQTRSKATRLVALTGEGFDPSVSEFPFTESFDGSSFPPVGWLNQKTAGASTGTWKRVLTGTYPDCMPHSGEAMAQYNCFSYSAGTEGILVTPPISFGSEDYEVSLWMYRDDGYPDDADQVNVYAGGITNLAPLLYWAL
jgi:hypothetical protein